ncbi:hypothetical protein JOB18_014232 [Solea senegalensis]|uniref:Uncharacterized protein n=1 Tax=Solea senegalensis TaxID=28829 RepID=A0AAV6R4G6_SOLSE|nr:hypothetical protein JOB18_014232 [Solea senegalensis]
MEGNVTSIPKAAAVAAAAEEERGGGSGGDVTVCGSLALAREDIPRHTALAHGLTALKWKEPSLRPLIM